ncbi:uncharacterized protein BO87DRAFT_309653 [Aspergillus neoniger CBS 115656]|uniref:Uncharacterized protein n=1 Tax=Aspergillus neoniger (strain CBS 115656) TaxID=1448310 RepID=A0A318YHT2_ASPNB|nr:hypothetical protein BO87DRAFT_309653 [Aspergillus neoniger CBS 115656]PYH33789.1 hypothetical protein BO87DRAFT_309653 [Aspergillus neoniger CBS 115656]
MATRSRWFSQEEIGVGATIQLDHKWVVREMMSEHTYQHDHDDTIAKVAPSWTAVRLRVEDRSTRTSAYMRIYKQIMNGGTEAEPARIRARQADSTWCPVELKVYRSLPGKSPHILPRLVEEKVVKQDESGCVAGGFLIYVVWEIVPGIQLGDSSGSNVFWTLDRPQRDAIRELFKKGRMHLYDWGYYPHPGCGQNLVWHAQTSTLYFVGWFLAYKNDEKKPWTPRFWYFWDLTRPAKKSDRSKIPDETWTW